jgi:Zn-dependent M28 family amino/carboxypeptidase
MLHYDTKTFDTIRFVGANDSGSSTGLLLELARVLGQHPHLARQDRAGVLRWRGGVKFSETDGLYGSRYFAKQLGRGGPKQFQGGLLFDMVGDRSRRYFAGGFAGEMARIFLPPPRR